MTRDLHLKEAIVLTPATSRLIFELDVDKHWANFSNNLHGGAQATIFDICTSVAFAPIAKPGFWMFGGVSRTLNCTYLRPAPVGETVIVDVEVIRQSEYHEKELLTDMSKVVHAGKRLALTRGEMKRKSDGAIISTCEHNKANTDPAVSSKL